MELKLSNSKKKLSVDCIGNPPTDGWWIQEVSGKRKILRELRVGSNKVTEDFIRYVKPENHIAYNDSILSLKISRPNENRMGKDRYIYKQHNGFFVRVGTKYLGWYKTKPLAKKRRDTYLKETAQMIQQ